jgi:hypothetical protein
LSYATAASFVVVVVVVVTDRTERTVPAKKKFAAVV